VAVASLETLLTLLIGISPTLRRFLVSGPLPSQLSGFDGSQGLLSGVHAPSDGAQCTQDVIGLPV